MTTFAYPALSPLLPDAVELYRGELLSGLHVPDAAKELEQWVDAERNAAAEAFAQSLEAVAITREESGDYRGAVVWWRRLATQDPYSARTAVRLMRALAAAGDRAAAIQHARIYEALMADDLESQPDPEVAALAQELQSGVPTHATPARRAGSDSMSISVASEPQVVTKLPVPRPRSWWSARTLAIDTACLLLAAGGVLVVRLRNARATPVIH